MKLLIVFVVLFLSIPKPLFSDDYIIGASGGSAGGISCDSGTDLVGNNANDDDTSATCTQDRMYITLFTPSQSSGCSSGTTDTAYVEHGDTGSDNVKLCIYEDDGDETADSGDTLVECTTITSSAIEVASASAGGGTIDFAKKYWIGIISDSTQWSRRELSPDSHTLYFQSSLSYASPPSNLAGSWTTAGAYGFQMWVTVGP